MWPFIAACRWVTMLATAVGSEPGRRSFQKTAYSTNRTTNKRTTDDPLSVCYLFTHANLRKGFTMAKKKAALAKKPMTKSEILTSLSESSELSKKEIAGLFDNLSALIAKSLKKGGPGVFTVPGLSKIKVVRKPATKARKGINPFTKEETIFKAKPARNVVKVQPLKALKDMV